jgi:hypothetical protein
MHRAVGAFEFELDFSRDLDIAEFGEWLIAPDFTASYQFNIDNNGNWTAKFDNQFVCADPYYRGTSKDFEFDWTGTGQWSRNINPFPRKVTYTLTPQ